MILRFHILINLTVLSDRKEGIPVYAWITALIKSVNIYIDSFVLSNYALCIVVRVKRIHQYEWHVSVIRFI